MSKSISFRYSSSESSCDYISFFSELADQHSLALVENCSVSRQFFTVEDLIDAVSWLGIDRQGFKAPQSEHGLDEECAQCLTRVVDFNKRVYGNGPYGLTILIEFCEENCFPVLGLDIWKEGCSSLPAGMCTVGGEDASIESQVVDAVRKFKASRSQGSDPE